MRRTRRPASLRRQLVRRDGSGITSMNVACFAVALSLASLLTHAVWWRVRLPKSQTLALAMLFGGVLAAGLSANALAAPACPCRIDGFWEGAQVCLFHIAMAAAYIEFYTAIEEDSPTLTLLWFVKQAGGEGRTEEELHGLIDDDFVVGGRLRALVEAGFVASDGDVYRLTAIGRIGARWLELARLAYHLPVGG